MVDGRLETPWSQELRCDEERTAIVQCATEKARRPQLVHSFFCFFGGSCRDVNKASAEPQTDAKTLNKKTRTQTSKEINKRIYFRCFISALSHGAMPQHMSGTGDQGSHIQTSSFQELPRAPQPDHPLQALPRRHHFDTLADFRGWG